MMRSLQLADFLTLANAACGVAAVFAPWLFSARTTGAIWRSQSHSRQPRRVRRARRARRALATTQSLLGRELDSLADVISFGVAPATSRLRRAWTASGTPSRSS
jgi:CDP-diacylglycerol--serine O-phosphatidyltransferase